MAYKEDFEDEIVSEGAEYSPKSDFSKARVVEECVKKIFDLRSREMKAGYHNVHIDKDGIPQKTWVPDSRQIFCGAMDAFLNLLLPEIEEFNDVKKIYESFLQAKRDLLEKYIYTEKIKRLQKHPDGTYVAVWLPTERKYLPEIDEELDTDDPNAPQSDRMIKKKGLWNAKVNAYWNDMVKMHTNLFGELNKLIHRKNYFKRSTRFG